ncbi:hypothetical protein B0T22DRAFT_104232 [Podospora appendiculata]|uniref:Mid2 domain-containing protein n=1 Tax=Podospora appendiculata TaxID=314037 RepID=A0AAE0XLE1_9PEZI|nr:hypothetical protein B0T22DRAFT_104232 [Podospora appendiculata]
MSRPRISLRAALLAAMFTTSGAIPASELFARQSSCAADFNKCTKGNFPDYFCCPKNTTCINLAGNTTLLCCPSGNDCTKIKSISCDITLQDGKLHPEAVIKTTALGGTLGRCKTANTCCPFGYTCTDSDECVMNQDQSMAPSQAPIPTPTSSPSSTTSIISSTIQSSGTIQSSSTASTSSSVGTTTTPSTSTTSTETGVAESATTTAAAASPQAGSANTNSGPAVGVIAGASVGAAVIFIAAVVLACILLRRKEDKKQKETTESLRRTRSTSSFGNIISHPIVSENTTLRTDFSRFTPLRNVGVDSASKTNDTGIGRGSLDSSSSTGRILPRALPSPARNPTYDRATARQSSIAYGFEVPKTSPYMNSGSSSHNSPYTGHVADRDDSTLLNLTSPPPRTPERREREPSSVSINVFADPQNITPQARDERQRYSHLTTFTQMMDEADLGGVARGQGYVPYRPPPPSTDGLGSPMQSKGG